MAIQFVGINSLSDAENSILARISKNSMPKIERTLDNSSLILKIKKEEAGGKRARFIVHAQINHPSVKFKAKGESWDFAPALHGIFDKLITEISKTQIKKRQKTVSV